MAYYWIKLYHEVLHDPKMGRMPDRLWRRTIELFLLAGENGNSGQLPSLHDMAWMLHSTEEELQQDLLSLAEEPFGIVLEEDGSWAVQRFASRQAPVSSAERARQSRQRGQGQIHGVATQLQRTGSGALQDGSGPAAKSEKKEKNPPHPAIIGYKEAALLYPRKSLWPGIIEAVGDEPEDIDRWSRVCLAYVAMGWNPKNVKGMLDHFTEGRMPGDKQASSTTKDGRAVIMVKE